MNSPQEVAESGETIQVAYDIAPLAKSLHGNPVRLRTIRRTEVLVPRPSVYFNPTAYLTGTGPGRLTVQVRPKELFFCQGNCADSIFYLQKGRAKLTACSPGGKEATIVLFGPGDFVGEDSLGTEGGVYMATATATEACTALKIARREMVRVMEDEEGFCELFIRYLLARNARTQADLLDQRLNFSEKRLARILLSLADSYQPSQSELWIPMITQEALAEMVGVSRSRINFFMNGFRRLGYIKYGRRLDDHHIWVDKAGLQAILAA